MKNIINFVIFSSIFIFGFSFFTPNLSSENKTSKGGNPVVLIKTNKGDIKVELYKEKAPITVENFLIYVNEGFYNGTIFHRVINNFMIQAGGLTLDLQQKPAKSPIKNEANNGLKNVRGSIAMGRTAVVDSATSHFYINHVDNESLDHGKNGFGYAVFGQTIEGMDLVDTIAKVQTARGDVPVEPVIIESITVIGN